MDNLFKVNISIRARMQIWAQSYLMIKLVFLTTVQKTVNIAELGLPSLGLLARLALGWHLGTGISGGFPLFLKWWGSFLCLSCLCTNNVVSVEPQFPSWSLGFWQVLGRGWPAPSRNPRHWISDELPWQTAFHRCCHSSFLGYLAMFCVTPLGEDSGSWCLAFTPRAFSLCLLCFASFRCNTSQLWGGLSAEAWESF